MNYQSPTLRRHVEEALCTIARQAENGDYEPQWVLNSQG